MGFAIPATSRAIITIVVVAIAGGTFICLGTLAACMLLRLSPEQGIITAFVGLTGQLVGSLTSLLSNTRSSPGTDADMPKTIEPTTTKPVP